jgi:alpha-tubulin suppressor-like RCC1 family protein
MTAVAAGSSHSVALKNDGTVWTWGDNRRGQLGMGGSDSNVHSTPAQVPGLTDVTAVSARGTFTLALKSDGTVWSWGSNHITETDGSSLGGLGDGTNKQHNSPVEIIKDVKKIAAGIAHALVLKNDGTIWGWGNNFSGQLGDGTNVTPRLSPVKAVNITDIKDISLGRFHSLVLKNDGTVWGWGNGLVGQLGDGKRNSVNTPVKAAGLTDVKVISTGENHSLAVRENGEIWLWGNNSNTSPLGVGTSETVQDSPARLTSLTGIKTASAGSSSNIALKDNGTLWAWGGNGSGQLGDGKTSSRSTPGEIGINIGTASPPKMVTSSLPGGTVGTAYSQTLKADGSGPMTWSIESGTLPNGLVLSPIKGTITGTPAASGPFALVLKATNSEGSATVEITLTISEARR